MRNRIRLIAAASLLTCAGASHAVFTNGGFEQNNLAGWTLGGGRNPGLAGAPPFTGSSVQITPGAPGPASVVGAVADPRAPGITLPRVGQYTAKINDENTGALLTTLSQTDTITNADIVVLVLDAESGILEQDKKIADIIVEARRACVVVVNKWDLLKDPIREAREKEVERRMARERDRDDREGQARP